MSRRDDALTGEMDWEGYLTIHNAETVADRIRRMFVGKRFAYVSMNHCHTRQGILPPYLTILNGLRVRMSTWDEEGKVREYVHVHHAANGVVHIGMSLSPISWGMLTDKADQEYVDLDSNIGGDPVGDHRAALYAVHISFTRMSQMRIISRAPMGPRVEEAFVVDTTLAFDLSEED